MHERNSMQTLASTKLTHVVHQFKADALHAAPHCTATWAPNAQGQRKARGHAPAAASSCAAFAAASLYAL